MAYPLSGSTLTGENGVNKTSTSLSTNILVVIGATPVGAIQRLNITERRNIKKISELGFDGILDSFPNESTDISGSCERIRFDRLRMAEAFGRSFTHVHAQRFPFDIVIIDNFNGNALNPSDTSAAIITTIKNVWISEIAYSYQASDWVISETMNWTAEAISSTLGGGSTPAAQGGERGIPISLASPTSDIERAADVGKMRGSLSAPGILRDFLAF